MGAVSVEELNLAIAAAREGRRDEARARLMRVVASDGRNERAWLWLSGMLDDPSDVRICLENVLALNPTNARARQGLEWIHARLGLPQPMILSASQGALEREIDPAALSPARLRAYTAVTAPAVPARTVALHAAAAAPVYAAAPPLVTPPKASAHVAAPVTAPRPVAPEVASIDAVMPESLCPYCAAPAALSQRSCTQCGNSLMTRVTHAEHASLPLAALALLWYGGAIVTLLLALAFPSLGLLLYQQARFGGAQPDAAFPLGMLVPAALLLLLAGIGLSVARLVRQRLRTAFYLAAGLSVAGLIGALLVGARAAAAPAIFALLAGGLATPADWVPLLITATGVVAVGAIVLHVLALGLAALSYPVVVGKLERFQHRLLPTDHMTHYNNGVALKDRGMWHAASLEWEWAVKKAPSELIYLRALGLAYARLNRFDRARDLLDRALRLAPDHPQLAEDRRLVEQLVREARR